MTTDHTELCERLRSHEDMVMRGLNYLMTTCAEAAASIEQQAVRLQQQALEYVSLQAQCDEHLARVAEVEKERDGLRASRIAYASEFPLTEDGEPDLGSIHENIRKLKAERDALKADAERYRWLRDFGKDGVNLKPPCEHVHTLLYSHPLGVIPTSRVITGDELDRAIDAALQAEKRTR